MQSVENPVKPVHHDNPGGSFRSVSNLGSPEPSHQPLKPCPRFIRGQWSESVLTLASYFFPSGKIKAERTHHYFIARDTDPPVPTDGYGRLQQDKSSYQLL